MDSYDIAYAAYRAYAKATGGLNYLGGEMPKWDDLPPQIQDAWRDAANRANIAHAFGESKYPTKITISFTYDGDSAELQDFLQDLLDTEMLNTKDNEEGYVITGMKDIKYRTIEQRISNAHAG